MPDLGKRPPASPVFSFLLGNSLGRPALGGVGLVLGQMGSCLRKQAAVWSARDCAWRPDRPLEPLLALDRVLVGGDGMSKVSAFGSPTSEETE